MSSDNLPDGWTRVKFGDVVRNCNHNSRDLDADGIDRVVGLDHLDPGSLRLVRWDHLADLPDGTTFRRKFKPGQVLFGKRRAYQRKVAVADFDGVCSGDILVFEPADKRMLAEFLPYVVQSDGFFDHALGTSAGSLSPRTKWAELAKYEFALPPADEQRKIVDLVASADAQLGAVRAADIALRNLSASLVTERVWNSEWELAPISDVWEGSIFFDGDWIESKDQSPEGIRLLQLADIGSGWFLDKSSRYISEATLARLKCSEVLPGDLLISRMADPIGRSCLLPDLGYRAITVVDVCVVRHESSTPSEAAYWLAVTNSRQWVRACEQASGGTTRTRVSRSKLEQIPVPNAPAAIRQEIGQELMVLEELRTRIENQERACTELAIVIREELLKGGRDVQ